jgi:serine O-acetyltransferase
VVGAGAKILGPISVGANARVGSNSVVVRDVPEGATVVGIPGRIVPAKVEEKTLKRQAMAEKIGFDAYGQHHGQLPDPVNQALDRILDHLHSVDDRLDKLDRHIRSGKETSDSAQGALPLEEPRGKRRGR